MPEGKKRLLPAMAGVLVAAGLTLPGTFAEATAAPTIPLSGPVKWSGERGPVPKAIAHTTPALTTIALSGRAARRLLFWTGPSLGRKDFQISYQTSISLKKNLWSTPSLVDGGKATTNSRPAATPDPVAFGQVIVVWKDAKRSSILYSFGKASTKSTTLTWDPAKAVPGAATSNGPAAFSTFASGDILIVWKDASSDAIDFIVGTPLSHDIVKWGKVGVIPGAATTSTPAIAEVVTGKPIHPIDEVYVLWKTPGRTGLIDFAFAADSPKFFPKWTKPGSLPSTIKTLTAPSAEAVSENDALPLLVVYTKPGGSTLEYVTMAAHGAVTAGPFKVPQLQSTNGTTIDSGVIAAQAPAPVSAARILDPDNIFYLPFVRPCAGC
jgi:hypothetical protein